MSTTTHTHEQTTALAALVRNNILTPVPPPSASKSRSSSA